MGNMMRRAAITLGFTLMLGGPSLCVAQASWKPAAGPLTTPWTSQVNPTIPHPEYPRPQLVRSNWQNLNGLWDYAITPLIRPEAQQTGAPSRWQGKILVPFPVESDLSGVKKRLGPDQLLWYQRVFTVPSSWKDQRVLLHFGAVDWRTTVWVNGKKIGIHEGGYDPFTFDITAALETSGPQQLTLSVWDPSDSGYQPVGKQSLNPRTIWYTATSGVWQTVWLEPVPREAIKGLRMTPDIDQGTLRISVASVGDTKGNTIHAIAFAAGRKVAEGRGSAGESLSLKLPTPKLWSPDHPFLYDMKITLEHNGQPVDQVKSYFGMRKISLGKDGEGITRLFLNNEPLFQFGPLDQGFWPDGLYTAPTDAALKSDIQKTKRWGFNMIRKHVKVEPQRWYYWCDKLGMLVWQDMPSGDGHIKPSEPDISRVAQSAYDYKIALRRMINGHYNHPSIVVWVPFNEGWGQFKTAEIAALAKRLDPSRLVNATTGWADRGVGGMHDMHKYPGPAMFPVEENRASVLGEFGGQALIVKGHLWLTDFSKAPSHYRTSQSETALRERYQAMADSLIGLRKKGLSAAVYTQTTDVEIEVNGIMTYDRKVTKFDEQRFRKLNEAVIGQSEK